MNLWVLLCFAAVPCMGGFLRLENDGETVGLESLRVAKGISFSDESILTSAQLGGGCDPVVLQVSPSQAVAAAAVDIIGFRFESVPSSFLLVSFGNSTTEGTYVDGNKVVCQAPLNQTFLRVGSSPLDAQPVEVAVSFTRGMEFSKFHGPPLEQTFSYLTGGYNYLDPGHPSGTVMSMSDWDIRLLPAKVQFSSLWPFDEQVLPTQCKFESSGTDTAVFTDISMVSSKVAECAIPDAPWGRTSAGGGSMITMSWGDRLQASLTGKYPCSALSSSADMNVACTDGNWPGSVCSMTCLLDNECLSGESTLTCQNNGLWSAAFPTCVVCSSCQALLVEHPSSLSGTYTIHPGDEDITVYCEMSRKDGGWTLVLRDSFQSYSSVHMEESSWNTVNGLDEGVPSGTADYMMKLSSLQALETNVSTFEYLIFITGSYAVAGEYVWCSQPVGIDTIAVPKTVGDACLYWDGDVDTAFKGGISFNEGAPCGFITFRDPESLARWWGGRLMCGNPCSCSATMPTVLPGKDHWQGPRNGDNFVYWILFRGN